LRSRTAVSVGYAVWWCVRERNIASIDGSTDGNVARRRSALNRLLVDAGIFARGTSRRGPRDFSNAWCSRSAAICRTTGMAGIPSD